MVSLFLAYKWTANYEKRHEENIYKFNDDSGCYYNGTGSRKGRRIAAK